MYTIYNSHKISTLPAVMEAFIEKIYIYTSSLIAWFCTFSPSSTIGVVYLVFVYNHRYSKPMDVKMFSHNFMPNFSHFKFD